MDSNDRERIGEAKDELMRMLAEEELKEATILVFANKQVWERERCDFWCSDASDVMSAAIMESYIVVWSWETTVAVHHCPV